MFRYNTQEKSWQRLGGKATDVIEDVRNHSTKPLFLLYDGSRWEPSPHRPQDGVFAWAWQPHMYNYIRGWGMRFDRTGRTHVAMPLHGLGSHNRLVDTVLYAWSDDLGETWHRADGSEVRLPLTLNPSPSHNAAWTNYGTSQRVKLWLSLLAEAGYETTDL